MCLHRPSRPLPRVRLAALGIAGLISLIVSGCDGGLFVDPAPAPSAIELQLALSAPATGAAQTGADAALDAVDRARITLDLDGAEGIDEVVDVETAGGEIRLSVAVELDRSEVAGTLEVELRTGSAPLYRGSTELLLERGARASVEITPEPVPFAIELPPTPDPFEAIGDSVPLPGAVVFATGDTIPGWVPDWNSQSPGVVAIEGDFAVATGEGSATLAASFRQLQETWTVRVEPVVQSIAVIPPSVQIAPGLTTGLEADLRDRRGNLILSVPVAWSSENAGVATVDDTGTVTGVAPGSTRVFARAGGLEAWADVQVAALPPSVQTLAPADVGEDRATLRARVDPRGASTSVVFEIATDPDFESVQTTDSSPLGAGDEEQVVSIAVEGLQPDTRYHVRGRATNEVGTTRGEAVSFDTEPAAVASVTLIPSELQIGPGQSAQLELELRDARGALLSDRPAEWRSDAPEIVAVDQDGVVTGVSAGSTRIAAVVEGIEGEAAVEVVLLPPLAETLSPSQVFETQARLDATVTPRTATTEVRFRYSPSPSFLNSQLTPATILEPSDEPQLVRQSIFNLDDNTTYYYRVEAVNEAGTVEGEALSFETLLEVPTPTNLEVFQEGSVFLYWDYPSEQVEQVDFEVERATGPSQPGTWSLRATVTASTFFADEGVQGGVTYWYRVRACMGQRCSDWSNVDSNNGG